MIRRMVVTNSKQKPTGPFDLQVEYVLDCSRTKLHKHFARAFQTCYVSPKDLRAVVKASGQRRRFVLESRYFPNLWKIRIGEFGECAATFLTKYQNQAKVPLLRLRFKEHPNFPMRGTDVICCSLGKTSKDDLLITAEVKARTQTDKHIVRKCYDGLCTDFAHRLATSLYYQEKVLRIAKRHDMADVVARFANPSRFGPYRKAGRAIVVADIDTWYSGAIKRMTSVTRQIRYPVELVLVKVKFLRKAVNTAYDEAARI